MMHEREKSDPAVVAVKPVNAAERSAAESVEPRAGAEGNASQHSTDRAQKRATVSQGLERIRQVARQRTEEKFTTLLHHISTDHLEQAFLELKEDAAPGVDGLRWRDYEADLEHNLEGLHASRSVPGTAWPAGLHTQAGRPTTPVSGCCFGGQDRPTGDDRTAKCDLRGRLPRVQLRVPAGARHARCA